jgi:hypothetical protein
MNRRRKLLIAPVVAVAAALLGGAPASADKGGTPAQGSCGLGKQAAHDAIALRDGPGASEFATFPPSESGCTAQGE